MPMMNPSNFIQIQTVLNNKDTKILVIYGYVTKSKLFFINNVCLTFNAKFYLFLIIKKSVSISTPTEIQIRDKYWVYARVSLSSC